MNAADHYLTRYLEAKDLDQYNALLRYTFQVTEEELTATGWKDDEIKQSKFPVLERADVLGCFDGDTLVSQFAVYPLKMNIYDTVYHVGFVTSVCTYPEYTGQGIMKHLMIKGLTQMHEEGKSFALLYPYSIPLYHHLGWEIVSNKISFNIKDRQIPTKVKAPGYVRRVSWDNTEFHELHSHFASITHGCLFRNSLAWEEYWRWDEDDTNVAVYYNVKDKPCGYMVYLIKNDIMHIKEMVYLNREAQKGLWEYIHAHDSMIDEVHGSTYFSEPIAFEMDDGDIKESIRPYAMGRIIDVEDFLADYPCDPDGGTLCIELEIEDSLLPWNDRTFNVRFADGHCTMTREPAEYHLKMGIGTFTTLLLGYKTAERLYELERIEGREEAVDLMRAARQVFCLGQGGSMLLANDICARFSSLSNKFRTAGDSHLQILAASLMGPEDVVLFISYSGATRDMLETLRTAKASGAKIILLTHYEDSPGAAMADVVLRCGAQESPLDSGSIPIKVAVLYVGEVLLLRYMLDDPEHTNEAQDRTSEAVAIKLI